MEHMLIQYLITFGWAITGAFSVAVALGISLKIYAFLTPINEWEELKKGNMSVAIVLSAIILGTCLVIGLTVMP